MGTRGLSTGVDGGPEEGVLHGVPGDFLGHGGWTGLAHEEVPRNKVTHHGSGRVGVPGLVTGQG